MGPAFVSQCVFGCLAVFHVLGFECNKAFDLFTHYRHGRHLKGRRRPTLTFWLVFADMNRMGDITTT